MNKQITDIKEQAIEDINKIADEATKAIVLVNEDEFQVGDRLEFSACKDFHSVCFDILAGVSTMMEWPFETKDKTFQYARRPYDRIIPHDGGDMPEWLKGKKVTVWYHEHKCFYGEADSSYRTWPEVIEYRVHKEESE